MKFYCKTEIDFGLEIGQKITVKELDEYIEKFFKQKKPTKQIIITDNSSVGGCIYTSKVSCFNIIILFEEPKDTKDITEETLKEIREQQQIIEDINFSFKVANKKFEFKQYIDAKKGNE